MSRVAVAKEKWIRKTKVASEDYCKGIADFLGVGSCNPYIKDKWSRRVGTTEGAEAWERGYRARMAG